MLQCLKDVLTYSLTREMLFKYRICGRKCRKHANHCIQKVHVNAKRLIFDHVRGE